MGSTQSSVRWSGQCSLKSLSLLFKSKPFILAMRMQVLWLLSFSEEVNVRSEIHLHHEQLLRQNVSDIPQLLCAIARNPDEYHRFMFESSLLPLSTSTESCDDLFSDLISHLQASLQVFTALQQSVAHYLGQAPVVISLSIITVFHDGFGVG
jgi:hypothetical protein